MNAILDFIAKAYLWFYSDLLQRPKSEPFTRQASRIEDKYPALVWGITLAILWVCRYVHGWRLIIPILIYLFLWWFIPHIVDYRVVHRDDNPVDPQGAAPVVAGRAARWATKRRDRCQH